MKGTQLVNIFRKYPGKKLRRTLSPEGLRPFRVGQKKGQKG